MIETLIGVGQENESQNAEPFFVGHKTQNKMAMHQHFLKTFQACNLEPI